MIINSSAILVVVNHLSRPVVVLDGLPGLYEFKYDSATACGLPLYLYSYKLVGSATRGLPEGTLETHLRVGKARGYPWSYPTGSLALARDSL